MIKMITTPIGATNFVFYGIKAFTRVSGDTGLALAQSNKLGSYAKKMFDAGSGAQANRREAERVFNLFIPDSEDLPLSNASLIGKNIIQPGEQDQVRSVMRASMRTYEKPLFPRSIFRPGYDAVQGDTGIAYPEFVVIKEGETKTFEFNNTAILAPDGLKIRVRTEGSPRECYRVTFNYPDFGSPTQSLTIKMQDIGADEEYVIPNVWDAYLNFCNAILGDFTVYVTDDGTPVPNASGVVTIERLKTIPFSSGIYLFEEGVTSSKSDTMFANIADVFTSGRAIAQKVAEPLFDGVCYAVNYCSYDPFGNYESRRATADGINNACFNTVAAQQDGGNSLVEGDNLNPLPPVNQPDAEIYSNSSVNPFVEQWSGEYALKNGTNEQTGVYTTALLP